MLPWLYTLCLVGLGLAATAALGLLLRRPDLFSFLVVACGALLAACAGVYLMWQGLGLVHTQDFSRLKWRREIDPKCTGIASKLFGAWFFCLGILVLCLVGVIFFRLPLRLWMVSLYLWMVPFQVLIMVFKKRRTPRSG